MVVWVVQEQGTWQESGLRGFGAFGLGGYTQWRG